MEFAAEQWKNQSSSFNQSVRSKERKINFYCINKMIAEKYQDVGCCGRLSLS